MKKNDEHKNNSFNAIGKIKTSTLKVKRKFILFIYYVLFFILLSGWSCCPEAGTWQQSLV